MSACGYHAKVSNNNFKFTQSFSMQSKPVKAIDWIDEQLVLLDQRVLPKSETYITCFDITEVIDAIKTMVVRGAPAIGIVAAYGAVISARTRHMNDMNSETLESFKLSVLADLNLLALARPTAVNLMWAVETMKQCFLESYQDDYTVESMLVLAKKIHAEDIANNLRMGELASDFMASTSGGPFSVMTHCNAGALATGGYGTALGAIRSAWKNKLIDCVYAGETRPWLQGARLTAWELTQDSIPVCLNVDGAAAWLLANKNIKWIIVGADRVTANGDVANKIGTYSLAVLAKYHGVKMMVVAPSSTVDMALATGTEIEIEMRETEELTQIANLKIAPNGVNAINPVFDVTPASLIDAIVTEKGVIKNPNNEKMIAVFG
jgi:methylthioribose-1-phosphate isomerase